MKVGDRVRSISADYFPGETGTVRLIDSDLSFPIEIEMDSGKTFWVPFEESELEVLPDEDRG